MSELLTLAIGFLFGTAGTVTAALLFAAMSNIESEPKP